MKKTIAVVALIFASVIGTEAHAAKVYVAAGPDRDAALGALFAAQPLPDLAGKKVAIKANFNSADPFPATTNLKTLEYVIKELVARKPASIVLPPPKLMITSGASVCISAAILKRSSRGQLGAAPLTSPVTWTPLRARESRIVETNPSLPGKASLIKSIVHPF